MLDVKIDKTKFERKWKALMPMVNKQLKVGLQTYMSEYSREYAKQKLSSNWAVPHQGMGTRTGILKKEFAKSIKVKGSTIRDLVGEARMGSGASSAYAAIQEKGGTITAKGKMLTVPLPAALTPAGVVKKAADKRNLELILLRSKHGGMTAFLGKRPKFISKNLGKSLDRLAQYKSRLHRWVGQSEKQWAAAGSGEEKLYWILVRSVRLKPRLQFYKFAREYHKAHMPKIIARTKAAIAAQFNNMQ